MCTVYWRGMAMCHFALPQRTQHIETENDEPADETKAPEPRTFMLCCRRMGCCLCTHADDCMAYNARHGLDDPRHQPEWLRRQHPMFRSDEQGTNPHL